MLIVFANRINAQNFSQFYLSETWYEPGGQTPLFYKHASTTDALRNVYVVGSTADAATGFDIIVQKFDPSGELLWEQTYDGGAGLEDYGADIFVDSNYDVFVTGAATQDSVNNLDLVVLKYKENGDLDWTYFYNNGGSPVPYDGGTAIIGDNNGRIYVTGASAGDSTLTDYVTMRLSANNGNEDWVHRYDYIQLNDIPTKITLLTSSLVVTGGSQISAIPTNSWELATIRYVASTGSVAGVVRTTGSSLSGVDEANDITIDGSGNVFVLGATSNNSTGFDISLYKFDEDLDLVWEQHFDAYGLEDKGFGVKTDDAGNIYAVGYVSTPNQGKNYSILKYNANGVLQWSREFNGLANLDDEGVQVVIRGDRIFVTGAARNATNSEITTMGFTADGQIFSVKSFESPYGLNDKPTAMAIDVDNNLVIVGQIQQPSNEFKNYTLKYNIMEKPIIPVYIDSVPSYNDREIIIRFNENAINLEAIDKKNFDAGLLKDFVQPFVIDSLNEKFPFDAGRLETFKIFQRMTTADSLSITRLGDTIPVPAFWATLSVMFPEEIDLIEAIDSLNTMQPMVQYGEVNGFGFLASNDPLYSLQSGLYDANYGINIEEAWLLAKGKSYIRAGVYDSGIHWKHGDFLKTTETQEFQFEDSKIAKSLSYYTGNALLNENYGDGYSPYLDGHGTAVAGIIGAIRNNEQCIAGIAGGDFNVVDENQFGVPIYSFRIVASGVTDEIQMTLNSNASIAIFHGTFDNPDAEHAYALNVMNHSWSTRFFSQTLEEQILFAFRNNCIFTAAAGNFEHVNTCLSPNCVVYPASFYEPWVMKTGASNANGLAASFSAQGNDVDFIAPGTPDSYNSINIPSLASCDYNDPGTSFAAPHVAGTAALMLGKHNLLNDEANYPNNLAPEDVETILKLTARDIFDLLNGYPEGPDVKSGYGIIDAGQSVLQVSLPYYYVQHNGDLLSHDFDLDASDINITIENSLCGESPGVYVADRYVVNQSYSNTLPIEHTVENHWGRPSSTDGFNNSSTVNCRPWVDYSYNETEVGAERLIEIETTTYCWHLTENSNGDPIDVWIPVHPSEAITAYSLHIRTAAPIDLSLPNESIQTELVLYPNPTNGNELFLHGLPENTNAYEMNFVNLAGRTVLQTISSVSENNKIDISTLEAGFYIVQIKVNNALIIRNFIKL